MSKLHRKDYEKALEPMQEELVASDLLIPRVRRSKLAGN
jgi:hypothetical protein